MNASTINTIGTVLGMINPAIGVITSLVGSLSGAGSQTAEKFGKVAGQVQDAFGVVKALTPLVEQFSNGNEVTPEEVRAALAGADTALNEFDRLIAEKSAGAGG